MNITLDGITLRDYRLSDVEDEVRWTNVDTGWFYADTPWMVMEKVDAEEHRADMAEIIGNGKNHLTTLRVCVVAIHSASEYE